MGDVPHFEEVQQMARRPTEKGKESEPDAFTREQIDYAREAVGEHIFATRAVDRIVRKYQAMDRSTAYRLVKVARAEVLASFQKPGEEACPLVATTMFLMSAMSDPANAAAVRINASSQLIRLLALNQVAKESGSDSVDDFLAELQAKKAAREQSKKAALGIALGSGDGEAAQ